MARPVHVFEPLWFDRDFKKSLSSLPQDQQTERLEELRDLALALADCRHPTHDPALARWRPSAYHVPKLSGAGLFEYRCRFPMRVIARWVGPSAAEPEGVVLLVAVTLSHDHRRLRDVLARNRSDLRDWP
jgi:hypothetical protein